MSKDELNTLKPPAETYFSNELKALKANDSGPVPPGWKLSPASVKKFIVGSDGKALEYSDGENSRSIEIKRKFYGDDQMVERAIVSVLGNRGLMLVGEPGTAKSMISELLAADLKRQKKERKSVCESASSRKDVHRILSRKLFKMRNFTISCRVINGTDDCVYFNDTVEYSLSENNFTNSTNFTINYYEDDKEFRHFLFIILLMFSVATVFGNVLVITAVFHESALHKVTNYMILSLAVADTIVGLVVMPFSAVQNAMHSYWIFGQDW